MVFENGQVHYLAAASSLNGWRFRNIIVVIIASRLLLLALVMLAVVRDPAKTPLMQLVVLNT